MNSKIRFVCFLILAALASACSKDIKKPDTHSGGAENTQALLIESTALLVETTQLIVREEFENSEAAKSGEFFFSDDESQSDQNSVSDPELEKKNLRDGLKMIFANPRKDGDKITYTPKAVDLCNAINGGNSDNEIQKCISIMEKISFEQTPMGDGTGVVLAKFDSIEIGKLDYTKNSLSVTLNLSVVVPGYRRIMQIASDGAVFDETATGKIVLALNKSDEQQAKFSLGVPETVNVSGMADGEPFSLYVYRSDNMLEVDVNSHVVRLRANIVDFMANFRVRNKLNELHPVAVTLAGINGEITLDNVLKKIHFNLIDANGKNALAVLVHGETGLAVRYAQLQADLAPAAIGVELHFEKLWQFGLTAKNRNYLPFEDRGENEEASAVHNFAQGTRVVRESTNKVYKVNDGRLFGVGTGWMEGTIDVSTGQCFGSGNNPSGQEFLFYLVDCI